MIEKNYNKVSKYNFWGGANFLIGYERKIYLDRIGAVIGNKLVKVIVGQRRAGKSYILRQIMHTLIKEKGVSIQNIFYVNKEYIAFDDIRNASDLDELFRF